MNCSIIIRAYNEFIHLPRLLEGIQHQTIKDVEIILVDSGSTDSTVSIAESFGARIVRIPSVEFTFGRSLNFGVRSATREYIVIASHTSIRSIRIGWKPSCARLKMNGSH